MKAVKKLAEVERDKSVTVKSLPFRAGSKVEVIIFPAGEGKDIFNYVDSAVKKKRIAPMTLKQIEKIVHEVRGVK